MKDSTYRFFIGCCAVAMMFSVFMLVDAMTKNSVKKALTATSLSEFEGNLEDNQIVYGIVGEASTEYDALGAGQSGLIIKNGDTMKFISVDRGSRSMLESKPTYILGTMVNGKEIYQPLYLNQK